MPRQSTEEPSELKREYRGNGFWTHYIVGRLWTPTVGAFRAFEWFQMRDELDSLAPAAGDRSRPMPIAAWLQAIGVVAAVFGLLLAIWPLLWGGLGLLGLGMLWAIINAIIETIWPN
jgi:hypothetical protein